VLTKDQIIELLKENPDWVPSEGASEEEMAWYEEALVELHLDEDLDDDEEKDDLDLDDLEDDDEEWDDIDEDWGDEEL
jgi:hypothetical protein